MAECQRVYRVIIFVVEGAIIHESTNASSLPRLELSLHLGSICLANLATIRVDD